MNSPKPVQVPPLTEVKGPENFNKNLANKAEPRPIQIFNGSQR